MAWHKETHDEYRKDEWDKVSAHLEGTILRNLEQHLIRKRQGEAKTSYKIRQDIASYVPHFARASLSLAGMIMQNEGDASRSWWDESTEMGGPEDEGAMSRIHENADGKETDWDVLMTQALVRQIGYKRIWGVVEGIERDTDEEPTLADAQSDGRLRVLKPQAAVDWVRDDTGRLIEVDVVNEVDQHGSVMEKHDRVTRHHVYRLDEVLIFEEQDGEDEPVLIERRPYGENGFQYTGKDGRPVLPIFTSVVPIEAPIGYMMAKYADWLFNLRNTRNYHLWTTALARPWVDAIDDMGQFDQQLWDTIRENIHEDEGLQPAELNYAAPPMDGAKVRNSTLKQERDDFYTVFFQSYGDAAREKTATEVRQDIAEGVQAYLALQTKALDEFENDALWRLAQVHMPNAGMETWGQATVERSTQFEIEDIEEQIQQLRDTHYPGESIPAGEEGRVNAVKAILDRQGIDYDEEEVRGAVRRQEQRKRQRAALSAETGVDLG